MYNLMMKLMYIANTKSKCSCTDDLYCYRVEIICCSIKIRYNVPSILKYINIRYSEVVKFSIIMKFMKPYYTNTGIYNTIHSTLRHLL